MKIFKYIKAKINKIPWNIKGVSPYYEYLYREKSKYSIEFWIDKYWSVGSLIPMFRRENKIFWYKITKVYYPFGDSGSDWGFIDARERDLEFFKITRLDLITKKNKELE